MAEMIRLAKNKNPFERTAEEVHTIPAGRAPDVKLEDLGNFEHADGEDHIGLVNETADQFQERMKAIRDLQDPDAA